MASNVSGNFGNYTILSNESKVISPNDGCLFGFLCTTSGTLDLYDGGSTAGTHFVSAMPVTAGQFVPIPCYFKTGLFAAATTAIGIVIWS